MPEQQKAARSFLFFNTAALKTNSGNGTMKPFMENKSDAQLVADYLAGDKQSLEILIGRSVKPIYSFLCRYAGNAQDAEDIAQETFVKAWRHLKKFDQQRNFKPWLFAIAKNTALDFLKKKKSIPFSALKNEKDENAMVDTIADPAPLPQELLERNDIADILSTAMEQLPAQDHIVLSLHYHDHFTFQEMAEVMKEPINTIKSQHRRALIKLRRILTDDAQYFCKDEPKSAPLSY